MKIKMIDLLNKIAKGEEIPKKVKYMNSVWEYIKDGSTQDYINYYDKCLMEFIAINKDGLNAEVEVIEEDKKIEFKEIEKLSCGPYEFTKKAVNELIENQKKLIDEISKLKDRIDAKN